jgi:hypothetical protein
MSTRRLKASSTLPALGWRLQSAPWLHGGEPSTLRLLAGSSPPRSPCIRDIADASALERSPRHLLCRHRPVWPIDATNGSSDASAGRHARAVLERVGLRCAWRTARPWGGTFASQGGCRKLSESSLLWRSRNATQRSCSCTQSSSSSCSKPDNSRNDAARHGSWPSITKARRVPRGGPIQQLGGRVVRRITEKTAEPVQSNTWTRRAGPSRATSQKGNGKNARDQTTIAFWTTFEPRLVSMRWLRAR